MRYKYIHMQIDRQTDRQIYVLCIHEIHEFIHMLAHCIWACAHSIVLLLLLLLLCSA